MAIMDRAQMAYAQQGYADAPTLGPVSLQDRLDMLTKTLVAVHEMLDGIEGRGHAEERATEINGLAPSVAIPGACDLAERAGQMAQVVGEQVRLLADRIGRI